MMTTHDPYDDASMAARELFVLMLDADGRIAGVSFPLINGARPDDDGRAWIGKHIHEIFVPSGWQGPGAGTGRAATFTGTYTAASVLPVGLTAFSVNVVALPERAASAMAYAAYARPLLDPTLPGHRDTASGPHAFEDAHALQRVAGGLAHDINNALFVIVGLAEELLDNELEPGVTPEQHLRAIIAKAGLAGKNTHHILRLSEINRPAPVPLEVQPLVEAVARRLSPQAPDGITVRVQCNAQDALVRLHPEDLEQILAQWFSNAVAAMPPAGGTIEIGLNRMATAAGDVLAVWVQDNGRGMSKEECDRCAEPYYSTTGQTGLGLSKVKALARGMRVPLIINSTPETGTRMQLNLPVEAATADQGLLPDQA